MILTIWGPLFIDFVKLSRTVGVSPTYILSIYTEHAGGDDQIVRDPVPCVEVPVDVSVEKGDICIVAADVTSGVLACHVVYQMAVWLLRMVMNTGYIHSSL